MNFELGRKYRVTFLDNSELIFIFIGGENANIQFEDGRIIPIQKLPIYHRIEILPENISFLTSSQPYEYHIL